MRLAPLSSVLILAAVLPISGCEDEIISPPPPIDDIPPGRVTDFAVVDVTDVTITLSWTAPGDDERQGAATRYDIRHSAEPDTFPDWWSSATAVESGLPEPKHAGEMHEWTLSGLEPSRNYYLALKAVDEASNWSDYSNVDSVQTTCVPDVTQPAEGASYCEGDTVQIVWTQNDCHGDRARVELLNGGEVCSVLADSIANEGSHVWIAERCVTDEGGYKIRVIDLNRGDEGESSGLFSIAAACDLRITHPSGGEHFCLDDTDQIDIAWETNACCGSNVRIELLHNGVVRDTIVESTSNDGTYRWPPQRPGDEAHGYKIRVTDLETGTTGSSDLSFSLSEVDPIIVQYPNGGSEQAFDDEEQQIVIRWTRGECSGNFVRIDLLKQNEQPACRTIVEQAVNSGQYLWRVQSCDEESDAYRVRILDLETLSEDSSDQSFAIVRDCRMDVTAPDGTNYLCADQNYTIEWTRSMWCDDSFRIDLYQDGDSCLAIGQSSPNDGHYEWSVARCDPDTTGYVVRVTSMPSGVYSESETPFQIRSPCAMQWIQSPAGQSLIDGDEITLTWAATDCCVGQGQLWLHQNGQRCRLIADNLEMSSSPYLWAIDACGGDPGPYRLELYNAQTATIAMTGAFSITGTCALAIVEPSGDEIYYTDEPMLITWEGSRWCGDALQIELLRNGEPCLLIDGTANNVGAYEWLPQQCDNKEDGYSIRITAGDDVRESAGLFSIRLEHANVNFYLSEADYSGCSGFNDSQFATCQDLASGPVNSENGTFVWIVASRQGGYEDRGGIESLRFGIEYDPEVVVLDWSGCTGGSEQSQTGWPASGTANWVEWQGPSPPHEVAKVGFLHVAPNSTGELRITGDARIGWIVWKDGDGFDHVICEGNAGTADLEAEVTPTCGENCGSGRSTRGR